MFDDLRLSRQYAILFCLLLAFMLTLTQLRSVQAAGIVGDGTPASCTENALLTAVIGGGTITFNCGQSADAPVTIMVTARIALLADTVIDGGAPEAIILNGGDTGEGERNGIGLFLIHPGINAELRNLTLLHAGDSAIINQGSLTLQNSVVQEARALQCAGIQSSGTLTLLGGSMITTNQAETFGGGVCVLGGTANFTGGDIRFNGAERGGGLYITGNSTVASSGSYFAANRTIGQGAAIFVDPQARLTLNADAIVDNIAEPNSPDAIGGSLYNAGEATLHAVVINQNQAYDGGGIYNSGTLTIQASDVERNSATNFGGGFYNNGQLLYQGNSLVTNSAGSGGGFYNSGNLTLVNSTVADNSATSGGNLVEAGSTMIHYSTLTGNTPQALARTGGSVTVLGSILDGCATSNGAINSGGYNLDTGNSCGFAQPSDRVNTDPQLGALQQIEGRYTWHRLPVAGSPAIGGGEATCPTTTAQDQHGAFRPAGAACTIGAVEIIDSSPTCGGTFTPSADVTLDKGSPTINHGASPLLHVRNHDIYYNTLLAFALDPAKFPAGMYVSKATLELTNSYLRVGLPPTDLLHVRAIHDDWDEMSVTWATQPVAQALYASGGTPSSGHLSIDVTTLVTQWVTGQITTTSLLLEPRTFDLTLEFSAREGAAPAKLIVQCSRLVENAPSDPVLQSTQQEAALLQLQNQSAVSVTTIFENRALTFGEFAIKGPSGVLTDALAIWFLENHKPLLGTTDGWQLIRRSPDGEHLFFRQLHQGVPVYPAEIGVHLDGDTVTGIGGNYVPEITLALSPTLSAEQAEQIAINAVDPAAVVIGRTQLRYVNLGLLGDEYRDAETHLAWRVHLSSFDGVLIDAHSGALLDSHSFIDHDFDLDLETANGTGPSSTCWAFTYDDDQWFDEDGVINGATPDQEGYDTYNRIKSLYYWWWDNFRRDSYDNDGDDIQMYIHVDDPPSWGAAGYPNARYNRLCDIFEFATNTATPDNMAHEYMHGVVKEELNSTSQFQQGALNESLADTFAAFFDGNWTLGEGSAVGIIRNLSNPPATGDPDRMSNYQALPSNRDRGGIHINNGILNKAAFLITAGQNFNGHSVVGIGLTKAMRLYYNVLLNRLTSNSDFFDMRNQIVAEAKSLRAGTIFSPPFFTNQDVCSVIEAFAAVELGPSDRDCNGLEDSEQDDDGDGVPNTFPDPTGTPRDNCRTVKNPLQENHDGDALGNVCDPDNDNDGTPDFEFGKPKDNCRWTYNPGQEDRDRNGIGDACDQDLDGDGFPNTLDNCPVVANPRQENVDLDLFGDACDVDADNDLICNIGGPKSSGNGLVLGQGCLPGQGAQIDLVLKPADNCPVHANYDQADSDKDGIGNSCDLCPTNSSSDNGDPDGDGRGNPCDPDDDNDGIDDYKPDGSPLDNCREIKNPDQFDGDQNGIGVVCDPNEQAALTGLADRVLRLRFKEGAIVTIPIDACPACVLGNLPPDLTTQLVLETPVNVAVRIVDSNGFVLAQSSDFTTRHILTFSPAPFASQRGQRLFAPLVRAQRADDKNAAALRTAGDERYVLELLPADTIDFAQDYSMNLATTTSIVEENAGVTLLYLPLVVR